jgi:hypothetical protein
MRQITFANQASFEKYARPSCREQFLNIMETIVPWAELEALIAPYYPKAGNGRQPVGLAIMLRIYFLQHWFNLSDPGAEDALYESPRCDASPASIWAVLPLPTSQRFWPFATYWNITSYAAEYSIPRIFILMARAFAFPPAPSSTQRLSRPLVGQEPQERT